VSVFNRTVVEIKFRMMSEISFFITRYLRIV
jgi:hypothetical protein